MACANQLSEKAEKEKQEKEENKKATESFKNTSHFIRTHCTIPIPVEFDRLMSVSSGSDVDMRVCLDGKNGTMSG